MQPHGYNAIADTISTLASYGAEDRWIMTYTFLALGICVLVTALGLRTAALPGRLLLSAGGIAAATVAFFPQPAVGSSATHISIACFVFISLAVWPVLAWRRGERTPHLLRPRVSFVVGGVLLGMCCWYVVELHSNGDTLGLAERIVAGCQAVWILLVAVSSTRLVSHGTAWRISPRTNRLLGRAVGREAVAEEVLGLPSALPGPSALRLAPVDTAGAEGLAAGLRSDAAGGPAPDAIA